MKSPVTDIDIQRACRRFNIKRDTCLRYLRRGAPPGIAIEFAAFLSLNNHTLIHGTRTPRRDESRRSTPESATAPERATAHRL